MAVCLEVISAIPFPSSKQVSWKIRNLKRVTGIGVFTQRHERTHGKTSECKTCRSQPWPEKAVTAQAHPEPEIKGFSALATVARRTRMAETDRAREKKKLSLVSPPQDDQMRCGALDEVLHQIGAQVE